MSLVILSLKNILTYMKAVSNFQLSGHGSICPFCSCNTERFAHLHVLHLNHHCVPATSAAMERLFSSAGYVVNSRRNRLSDALIQDMIIAKCNSELLQ